MIRKDESPNSQDFKKHLEKYENAMQASDKNKLQERRELSMQLLIFSICSQWEKQYQLKNYNWRIKI